MPSAAPGQEARRSTAGQAGQRLVRRFVVGRLADVGLVVERQVEDRRHADGDGDLDGCLACPVRDQVAGGATDAAAGAVEGSDDRVREMLLLK